MQLTELTLFILLLLCNAFAIIGFNRSCWYDDDGKMLLWLLKKWSDKTLGVFWSKPVYSCTTCMASLHGLMPFWITYLTLYSFTPLAVGVWAFYTATLAGVISVVER